MSRKISETIANIKPTDQEIVDQAWAFQDQLIKVPRSLGCLEELGVKLCAIAGSVPPPVPHPAQVAVFVGDHGVQANKVSPWPQDITWQMGANVATGGAAVCSLARHAGADVKVYNVGGLTDIDGVINCRIAAGTRDMSTEPAMSHEQAEQAIEIGIDAANDAIASGHKALIAGELGIANTTPAAALIRVFTKAGIAEVTGRGAGANDEMMAKKRKLIAQAIAVNQAIAKEPLHALASVGGFEHAAMVGLMLAGAANRVPVILDGVIACSAALVAQAMCPQVVDYFIAGHDGKEPGISQALQKLDLKPILSLNLCLGEGSGAVAALPLVQASAKLMREMAHFGADSGVCGDQESEG